MATFRSSSNRSVSMFFVYFIMNVLPYTCKFLRDVDFMDFLVDWTSANFSSSKLSRLAQWLATVKASDPWKKNHENLDSVRPTTLQVWVITQCKFKPTIKIFMLDKDDYLLISASGTFIHLLPEFQSWLWYVLLVSYICGPSETLGLCIFDVSYTNWIRD